MGKVLDIYILLAFMLRSVPASVAFEPKSKNKKKGDKRGVLGGI